MSGLLDRFRHIAIEGPIGVGKSTLARRLATHLNAELLLEKAEENPYLERFYGDMAGFALQTQLFFLFQRMRQMQSVAQAGMFTGGFVSDFMFAKDALFARMNLSDDEYRLYAQIYDQAAQQVHEPDLIVWLQATPETLLQRIRRRGLRMEQGISADYLERLSAAYIEHFANLGGTPLFAVVTDHFNPVDEPEHFEQLLERLGRFDGLRGVYDPAPPSNWIPADPVA